MQKHAEAQAPMKSHARPLNFRPPSAAAPALSWKSSLGVPLYRTKEFKKLGNKHQTASNISNKFKQYTNTSNTHKYQLYIDGHLVKWCAMISSRTTPQVGAHWCNTGACGQHDDVCFWVLRQQHLRASWASDKHLVSWRHILGHCATSAFKDT